MEVNQEGNKDEKHPDVKDVGKEIHQGQDDDDNRWSLKEEVTTLIEDTLRLGFSNLEQQPKLFGCKKEYGDYQCENVLSIWHQLRNNPESDLKKPTDVGEEIKKHLEKRDDMIKEVSIHDIGIMTFKAFSELPTSDCSSASSLDRAITYTFLKKHRLADCTVDFIELASELTLGKAEVWEEGSERVLGLHLLMFTEVLEESCLSILPHILCEYVYDLSVKFGRCLTSKVGSVVETTTLLLFEATAVVMDKCFHLSDITPQYSSLWVSNAQSSESSVEQPVDVNELEDVNAYDADVEDPLKILNPRFELISISLNVTTDYEFKKGKMFGHVSYGLLNPGSRHSVPFSSSMEISMELIITTEMKDNLLLLCKHQSDMRFSEF
nr:arginine--tRNA ligase, chloroplastic/mitochondrial [Tanacetum cinerariifolium]